MERGGQSGASAESDESLMRFFFDRRKAYRYVLQHPWCCSVKRLQGGVLFLKLRNILCSPAPSRALEIFDAASTISLPAPPPSSTPRRAHLYLLVESRRPIARLDRARHTRICATACCRSCTQRECAACERGADSVRIDARAPCASVRAPVGKAPHWTHSLSPCQTPRHLSARRRARSRRSSC